MDKTNRLVIILIGLLAIEKAKAQVARRLEVDTEIEAVPLDVLVLTQCDNKAADVYFLLDASTSIFIEDYARQRVFVREVVNRFDISPSNTRVGVLVYSRTYQVAFDLNRYRSKWELLEALNEHNIPYLTGVTNTDAAIRYVRTSDQFRNDVTKVIVVITDGYSQNPVATAAEAENAKRDGFYLFVIGVGQYTDEREWRAIASDPDDRFMFNITNYRGLDRLYSEIPNRICQLPPITMGQDTCTVQLEADLLFVAGPRGADNSFSIVQEVVSKIQAVSRQLTVNLLIGECSAESTTLQDPRDMCPDLGDATFTRHDTYINLLKDMRTKARDGRSRRPNVNQVAVVFLDHESMTLDRFGILREAQSARYDGIEVLVVDLGVAHSAREILTRMATQRENVFNTAHPEGVAVMTSNLLVSVCLGLNNF